MSQDKSEVAGTAAALPRCRCMSSSPSVHTPYCGPAPAPSDWLGSWNLDPVLLTVLVTGLVAGAYLLRHAERARQTGLGLAGLAAALAFISPLCALTVSLFAARTVHHLVVMGLLAPALAVAFPWRSAPAVPALLVLSAGLWAWHVPAVYSAAWDSTAVYWVMQAVLILPAWAFFSALFHDRGHVPLVGLVTLVAQMGFLGALLTFAPEPFYLEHLAHAPVWGLSAGLDQQLAGLIMWIPGMLPAAVLAGVLAWRLLSDGARA